MFQKNQKFKNLSQRVLDTIFYIYNRGTTGPNFSFLALFFEKKPYLCDFEKTDFVKIPQIFKFLPVKSPNFI